MRQTFFRSRQISPGTVLAALLLGTLIAFSFSRSTNPYTLAILSAVALSALCGGLTGYWLGPIASLVGAVSGLWYHLHRMSAPAFQGSEAEVAKKVLAFSARVASMDRAKYAVVAAVVVAALLGAWFSAFLSKDRRPVRPMSTRMMTFMAVFVALSAAINTLRVGSVSFGGFPIIYGGLSLGAIPGLIIGALADVVGFLIRPSAKDFNLAFVATSALTGMIPPLVLSVLPGRWAKGQKERSFLYVLIAIAVGQIATSVLAVPLLRHWIYGHPIVVTMGQAALKQLYSIPLYAFLYVRTAGVVESTARFHQLRAEAAATPAKP